MKIQRLRRQIDALDRKLVAMLNRRARLSLAIGRVKAAAGARLFNHAREREIARNVAHANRGPLTNLALQRLWKDLLQQTRAAVRRALHRKRRAQQRASEAPRRGKGR